MKKSEFRQLIREEIRKVLSETSAKKKYSPEELKKLAKMTPYNKNGSPRFSSQDLVNIYNSRYKSDGYPIDDKQALKAVYKIFVDIGYYDLDPRGYSSVPDISGNVTKNPDTYVTTDGKNLKDLNSKLTGKKIADNPTIPTKVPMSGKQYTDVQLANFFTDDDTDEWFEMFVDDERSGGYWHPQDSVIMANDWLKQKGYKFQVKKAVSRDNGENVTWTVK